MAPHVKSLVYGREWDLIMGSRVAEEFVVVEFEQKRNLMRVLSRYGAQHAEGGAYHVAAAFNGEFHDIFRVEIQWVGCE